MHLTNESAAQHDSKRARSSRAGIIDNSRCLRAACRKIPGWFIRMASDFGGTQFHRSVGSPIKRCRLQMDDVKAVVSWFPSDSQGFLTAANVRQLASCKSAAGAVRGDINFVPGDFLDRRIGNS